MKYEHISPLLRDLFWLRMPQRIEFKLSVLVFRCLHGYMGERATSCGGHGLKKEAATYVDVCPCHKIFVSYDDWSPRVLRRCTARLKTHLFATAFP